MTGLVLLGIVHELGHLAGAWVTGLPVRSITFGSGLPWHRWRLGAIWLIVRRVPFGGMVSLYPTFHRRSGAEALFLLGGVLGNIAVFALTAALDEAGLIPSPLRDPVGTIAAVQLLALLNLVPVRTRLGETDGRQLLKLIGRLWRKAPGSPVMDVYRQVTSRYAADPTRPAAPSAAAGRVLYHVLWQEQLQDGLSAEESVAAVLALLARSDLTQEERLALLDRLICDGLATESKADLARLDEWSRRALDLGPNIATVRGSRGAVLIRLGRYAEGKALLESDRGDDHDTGFRHLFIAKAMLGLGDREAAAAALPSVRQHLNGTVPGYMQTLLCQFEAELLATAAGKPGMPNSG
ncbi:M50 family metallopeptidase [Inquilinus limosus]|uniref:hypothetical protein n=1 Tax=Inquilinus limosus TaxID=171674 RepID=UPI003F159508